MVESLEVGTNDVWPRGFITRIVEQEMDPSLLAHSWTIIEKLEDGGTQLFVLKLHIRGEHGYTIYRKYACVQAYEVVVGQVQLAAALEKALEEKRSRLIRDVVTRIAEQEVQLKKSFVTAKN